MALDGGKYAPGWAEDAVGSDAVKDAGAGALPINADDAVDFTARLEPGSSSSCGRSRAVPPDVRRTAEAQVRELWAAPLSLTLQYVCQCAMKKVVGPLAPHAHRGLTGGSMMKQRWADLCGVRHSPRMLGGLFHRAPLW